MALRCKYHYMYVLLLSVVIIAGCHGGGHDDDDDDDDEGGSWDWSSTAGTGVLIVVIFGICGIISLISWLSCSIYSKCRKDRVGTTKIIGLVYAPPPWSGNLVFNPELAAGFGEVSDGFLRMGPTQLVRTRAGSTQTDGARWAVGMTTGKHVFEIVWPWGHRGHRAEVGVGFESAPIKTQAMVPLVGSNPTSWGLDIVRRKVLHNNRIITTCPTDGSYVPDRFLMYVNMDDGSVGYGNDVTYWGEVITDLPRQGTQPLYVMVGAIKYQSEISVNYKGSAPPDGGATTVYPSTSQAPPSYNEYVNNYSNKSQPPPIMVMPPRPPVEVMYEAPPPYSQKLTGVDPKEP